MAQLNVGQLQTKVDDLKAEFDLQRSIKDNTVNAKIQRSRDKICDILRKIQNKRPPPSLATEQSEFSIEQPPKLSPKKSLINKEVLDRRNYIFQFKMFLKRKKERLEREQEFKTIKLLDMQTEALQRWVTQDQNEYDMLEFFFSQVDTQKKGIVHNLQIKQFFHDNPLIMFIYQLNKDNIASALDSFPVNQRFHFTKSEFIGFLQKYQKEKPQKGYRQYIHLFDPLYKKVSLTDNNPRLLLLSSFDKIRPIFRSLEQGGLVNLDSLIRQIRTESDQLFDDAVHLVIMGVNLILESALQIIEIEYLNDPEYTVSWNQFTLYFDNISEQQEVEKEQSIKEEIQEVVSSDSDYFYDIVKPKEQIIQAEVPVKQPRIRNQRRSQSALYENVENKRFTVPKKYKFEEREKNRSPGIRKRWLEQQIELIHYQQEQAYKYKPFKANNVPYKCRERKYYQEILEKQEMRRKEIHERAQEEIQRLQQPFSFDGRDVEAREIMMQKLRDEQEEKFRELQVKFRASPIPWYCSLKLFERKKEEMKKASEMRKKIRRYWLQSNSTLPPRMQEHIERLLIKQAEEQADKENGQVEVQVEKKSFKRKEVPDFKKIHEKLIQEEQNRNKSFNPTVPKSPKFSSSVKQVERNYLNETVQTLSKPDPIQRAQKSLSKQPKVVPRATKKFEAQVQEIQLKKIQEMQLRERMYMEEVQRMEKKQLFLPRVQKSWAIADHSEQLKQQQEQKMVEAYQQQALQEQQFNDMMKEIFVRVYQRPLLMELESMKSEAFQQQEQDEEQQPYDMNPIGEQEEEEDQSEVEDPEGVEQVGEQAEQSLPPTQEYDGQQIEDGDFQQDENDEYLDLDNIDPELLSQLQKQALAEQYGLTPEQLKQLQMENYYDEDDNQDAEDEDDQQYRRHSF